MRLPNLKTLFLALCGFFQRPEIAPEYVRNVRAARCHLCPHNERGQCQICTCVIDAKVYLATEKCPATDPRRWDEYHNIKNDGL